MVMMVIGVLAIVATTGGTMLLLLTTPVRAFTSPSVSFTTSLTTTRTSSSPWIHQRSTKLYYLDGKEGILDELDEKQQQQQQQQQTNQTQNDEELNTVQVDVEMLRNSVFGISTDPPNSVPSSKKSIDGGPTTTVDQDQSTSSSRSSSSFSPSAYYNDAIFDVPAVEIEPVDDVPSSSSKRSMESNPLLEEVGNRVLNTRPEDLMYQQYPPPPSSAKHNPEPLPAGQARSFWQSDATTVKTVQGGSLQTWSSKSDMVQLLLQQPESQPMKATVELWQGPDYSPLQIGMYSEDGLKFPLTCLIGTPTSTHMNTMGYSVGVKNIGPLAYPFRAGLVSASHAQDCADERTSATVGHPSTNNNYYDDNNDNQDPIRNLQRIGGPVTIDGNGVHSFPMTSSVRSVQILLRTESYRPLAARIELLQGPQNIKQVLEVSSENGYDYQFFGIVETSNAQTMIRVVNVGDDTFPITAHVEPYVMVDVDDQEEDDMHVQSGQRELQPKDDTDPNTTAKYSAKCRPQSELSIVDPHVSKNHDPKTHHPQRTPPPTTPRKRRNTGSSLSSSPTKGVSTPPPESFNMLGSESIMIGPSLVDLEELEKSSHRSTRRYTLYRETMTRATTSTSTLKKPKVSASPTIGDRSNIKFAFGDENLNGIGKTADDNDDDDDDLDETPSGFFFASRMMP